MSSGSAGGEAPNPFSREGAEAPQQWASPEPAVPAAPEPAPQQQQWAPQEPPAAVPPGFDPEPTPAYPTYPTPAPHAPAPYAPSPYDASPYPAADPAAAAYAPYGVPTQHPRATTALVTGVVGLVLSLACGIGGLVGIAGIVNGRRVRRDIDADPARWSGRAQATGGFVTGIVSVVVLGLWVVLFAILAATGQLSS